MYRMNNLSDKKIQIGIAVLVIGILILVVYLVMNRNEHMVDLCESMVAISFNCTYFDNDFNVQGNHAPKVILLNYDYDTRVLDLKNQMEKIISERCGININNNFRSRLQYFQNLRRIDLSDNEYIKDVVLNNKKHKKMLYYEWHFENLQNIDI